MTISDMKFLCHGTVNFAMSYLGTKNSYDGKNVKLPSLIFESLSNFLSQCDV